MSYVASDKGDGGLDEIIELAGTLVMQNSFEEILHLVAEKALMLSKADKTLVTLITPGSANSLITVYADGGQPAAHDQLLHSEICSWMLRNNSSLLSGNIRSDPRFNYSMIEKAAAGSVLCIPLKMKRAVIGTLLMIKNDSRPSFTEADLSFMEKFSFIASAFLYSEQDTPHYLPVQFPKQRILKKFAELGLLGTSRRFVQMLQSIDAAAHCNIRILLEGESGTGKELVARAVHRLSSRSGKKFVAVDCGTIQPNLVESELFGHIRGAFTGASFDRKGLFEEADGGTLFMDEINNLPLEMQSKLLRALQDEEIRPVGSNSIRKVNVRIIAASSISLKKLVAEKSFREDLYYRLNVFPIIVPPLNERAEDIPLLADFFLRKFSSAQKKNIEGIQTEVLEFFMKRKWEGNIRELENLIERLVTLATDKQKYIDRKTLPPEFRKEMQKSDGNIPFLPFIKSLSESMNDYEEQLIRAALDKADWNQSKAAVILKISEHAIRYKIEKFKICRPPETIRVSAHLSVLNRKRSY